MLTLYYRPTCPYCQSVLGEAEVVGLEAATGADAIRRAERERPDIVLLDVHLPDMDGFEVAARLRAAGRAGAIILISTHPEADMVERLRTSAADGFIDKADLSASTIAAKLARLA